MYIYINSVCYKYVKYLFIKQQKFRLLLKRLLFFPILLYYFICLKSRKWIFSCNFQPTSKSITNSDSNKRIHILINYELRGWIKYKQDFFNLFIQDTKQKVIYYFLSNLLISKDIFLNILKIIWCHHYRKIGDVSPNECTRWLQQLWHRQIDPIQGTKIREEDISI